MKVVVLGAGAREHAQAWSLERHGHEVAVLPGNGGIEHCVAIREDDAAGVERYCREQQVRLVIVGPEAPRAKGMVVHLRAAGIPAFGPTRAAARLESSKLFSKRFMQRHGVATAEAWLFEGGGSAGADPTRIIESLEGRLVLKYDGLAAGKGVWVCATVEQARRALEALRERHGADAPFLIERRLEGDEVSVMALTDGESIRLLPPAQDHKALLDGDEGPNTGGMGAFCPVPQVGPDTLARIREEVVEPTLQGLRAEQLGYAGVLYFGLMLTAQGPRLLEYNVRLGDPETGAVLPLLETDLAELAFACIARADARAVSEPRPSGSGCVALVGTMELKVAPGASVSVVLASRGYPGAPETGYPIRGLERLDPSTLVFHGGTRREADGRLVTSGGRVLNVVARGASLEEAARRAYAEVAKIEFEGMQYRRDIGKRTWKSIVSA